jgi:uncharacterized membrane protein YqjE
MSAWWSLPQAAPVLLRHLLAYAELAEQDLANYSRHLKAQVIAVAIAAVTGFFTVAMLCVAVVAAYWDTTNRMPAIYWLLGGFAAVTLISVLIARSRAAVDTSVFASVKREWSEDRVILERMLAAGDHDQRK